MLCLFWNVFYETWVRRDLLDSLFCNCPLHLLLKWPLLDMVKTRRGSPVTFAYFTMPLSCQGSEVGQLHSLTSKKVGKIQVKPVWDSEQLLLFKSGCKMWIIFWASPRLSQVGIDLKRCWCQDFITGPLTVLMPVFIMKSFCTISELTRVRTEHPTGSY